MALQAILCCRHDSTRMGRRRYLLGRKPQALRGCDQLRLEPDWQAVAQDRLRRDQQAVKDKLKELHEDLAQSVQTSRDYTLLVAVSEWLDEGMDDPAEQTTTKYRTVLKPLLQVLGSRPVADLTAREVRAALVRYAATQATDTVSIARLGLERCRARRCWPSFERDLLVDRTNDRLAAARAEGRMGGRPRPIRRTA
jgi:hypothetical protein